jgi:hypothetical protein
MNKFTISMFCALRAAERTIVDGLLVKTFQLEGSAGGAGILNLEDGSSISFANQDVTIIGGYSAFHTEAQNPHSIDFIAPGNRGLGETDVRPAVPAGPETQFPSSTPELALQFRTMYRVGE